MRNNILALSATAGQIRRSRQEKHVSFVLERNIIYSRGVPMLAGNWSDGGFQLDHNCYWDASGRAAKFPGNLGFPQWQAKGQDAHSIMADPRFVDVGEYDFRLQPDSPAWKLGFQPIDASQAGLTGPADWIVLPKTVKRPALKLPGER